MTPEQDTKACPWCGETILAVAKKCKHCGEFLEEHPAERGTPRDRGWRKDAAGFWRCIEHNNPGCSTCANKPTTTTATTTQARSAAQPQASRFPKQPVWRWVPILGWRCIAHDKLVCPRCQSVIKAPRRGPKFGQPDTYPVPGQGYTGAVGYREKLSEVGEQTDDGTLKCPRCGGTQFTAKRSTKGKVVGFTTLGVGGLIAPKSQVKCVACGLKFKRG